jgi:Ubiquitin-binding domain
MVYASTAAAVRTARQDFFDTRVAGRAEMWAAMRLVCELVEAGDLADAQAVLDAAGGTCPTGLLWGRRGGVYDAWGERYVVPGWCVGWPRGVRREDGVLEEHAEGNSEEEGEEEDVEFWKDTGKGKGIADMDSSVVAEAGPMKGAEIKVRLRLSTTARDVIVKTGEDDSVLTLLRRVRRDAQVRLHTILTVQSD